MWDFIAHPCPAAAELGRSLHESWKADPCSQSGRSRWKFALTMRSIPSAVVPREASLQKRMAKTCDAGIHFFARHFSALFSSAGMSDDGLAVSALVVSVRSVVGLSADNAEDHWAPRSLPPRCAFATLWNLELNGERTRRCRNEQGVPRERAISRGLTLNFHAPAA